MPDPAADEEHSGDTAAEAEVRQANRRFYDAFEARDLDAMSDVWAHDDRVSCTHPGWRDPPRLGRGVGLLVRAVRRARNRCSSSSRTSTSPSKGDAAWVTVDENLISADGSGTVAAVNVFVRTGDRWRLVAHHGSAVAPQG